MRDRDIRGVDSDTALVPVSRERAYSLGDGFHRVAGSDRTNDGADSRCHHSKRDAVMGALGWRMSVTAAPPEFVVRGKAVSYVR